MILPKVYNKLRKSKLSNFFPKDFIKYLKEIYIINKNRNTRLVEEIKEISKILETNNIEYVFLKGSAMLVGEFYDDIGERMIGDIDFLIKESEGEKVRQIFIKYGYKGLKSYWPKDFRHLPRMVNDKKLFAIEAHTKLIDENKVFNPSEFLAKKTRYNNFYIPCKKNLLLHNIFNHQLNDFGYRELTYNYRNLIDTNILSNYYKIKREDILNNKYLKNYYYVMQRLSIGNEKDVFKNLSLINKFLFKIKFNSKILFKIHLFNLKILKRINTTFRQLNLILNYKEYRQFVKKKIGL